MSVAKSLTMSMKPLAGLMPWILTAIVASVAGAVSGVHAGIPVLSWASVLLFAVAVIATSLEINRPWWSHGSATTDADAAATATLINIRLFILAYIWGGLAMFAVYRLSGLRWQHGFQYAAGMGVIVILLSIYDWRMLQPESRLRQPKALVMATRLAALQAMSALAGLVFLLLSGKLASAKGDWAANQIFLGGGIAVLVLSAIAAFTQNKLMRTRSGSSGERRPVVADERLVRSGETRS